MSRSKLAAARGRARRRDREEAEGIQTILRAPAPRQRGAVQQAYTAIVSSQVRLIIGLNEQMPALEVAGSGRARPA